MKQERIEKTVNELKKQHLDGVIYASGANFQYILDTCEYYWQRCCMTNLFNHYENYRTVPEALLYVKNDGSYHIFTTFVMKETFKNHENVTVSYMDQFEDAMAPFISGKKIGVGFGCNAYIKETLKAIDETIECVDAEDLLKDVRCCKDADEIATMSQLAKFTDDAIYYVADHLKEGMTMREAENLLVEYGFQHNCPDFSFPPTIGFKTRNTITSKDVEYYDREWPLQEGTMIAFDVGYMNHGYCSDWGRTLYYGSAPEYVKKGYEALQAAQVYMVSQIVPYQTNVNELFPLVQKKVEELGYGDVLRWKDEQMLGHQIGIDCHEFPMVNKDFDFVLQPGMIFCSEPKMWYPNEGYMRVEDMILVTETGAEFLTNFDRTLFEIKK